MAIRVVIVSGIYPPDIGGPATHAKEVRDRLDALGHRPMVLTLQDGRAPQHDPKIVRISRTWPWPIRVLRVIWWLIDNRNRYDVVYATGMHSEAAIGARLAKRPILLKIVGDPAWERGRRLGLVNDDFDDFQRNRRGGLRVRAMRTIRTLAVILASAVTVPSEYLAEVVRGWSDSVAGSERLVVIRNGVSLDAIPNPQRDPSARPLRAIYVGRLVDHKRVEILIRATNKVSGASLTVVGDGPSREQLRRLISDMGMNDDVAFTGSINHDDVLSFLAESHVMLTAASYEGLPHTALEALACGTPVIASAAGGTAEAVIDGVNGVIVDPATPEGFADELTRLDEDRDALRRLMDGARESAQSWSMENNVRQLESVLARIAGGDVRATSPLNQ